MPRRRSKMADAGEDNCPLADPRHAHSPLELVGMADEELMRLVDAALDRLPVANLVAVAVAAEERRQARAEEARQTLLQEFEDRAREMGLSLDQVFPVLAYGARKGKSGSGSPAAV